MHRIFILLFRDALSSNPGFGDKKTYQMDFHNRKEAISETLLDIDEGADIVIVKPGIFYLDIISDLNTKINQPIALTKSVANTLC